MKSLKAFYILNVCIILMSCGQVIHKVSASYPTENMKVRIASLEIDSTYLNEYLSILKEEAAESIRLEDGVLCIFPMYQKENPSEIRLLEIYENEAAYQSHLTIPHFLHYKRTTQKMVKSLDLVEMNAIDPELLISIFRRIK